MRGIDVAKKYLGLSETKDRLKLMAFFKLAGFVFDPSKQPWCAIMVNSCEKAVGNPGTGKANARSFNTYGTEVEDWDDAQEGDICLFTRGTSTWQGHVAYFLKWQDPDYVQVLGGNQTDMVTIDSKHQDTLIAIRRPPCH